MVYVMSDIHGNLRRFESILEQIDLRPEDTLYVLGDVIDRNPHGIKILRRLMAMPNARLLLGNHEYMMLKALHDRAEPEPERRLNHWYRNGGKVTHDNLKRLRKELREEIFAYLEGLPVNVDIEVNGRAYKLTHAAVLQDYEKFRGDYRNEKEFAVWKRYTADHVFDGGCTVVFGHTATRHFQADVPMRIWYGNGMIDLDCGCAYEDPAKGGRLACLRLDDGKEFYSMADGDCADGPPIGDGVLIK